MCRSKPFSSEIPAIVRGPSSVDVTASSVTEGTSPIWGDRYLLEHNGGHLIEIFSHKIGTYRHPKLEDHAKVQT